MTMPQKEQLTGKKVVVTGGAGFVGSALVNLLTATGCAEIVVVDNLVRGSVENIADAMNGKTVRFIRGDIRDRRLMRDVVEGADTVFHQAALRITQCASEPRAAMEIMVGATFDLLEDCVHERVRKVVMASSASVYGLAEIFPTPETCSSYPNRTLYGVAKAFAEGMLRSFNDQYGLDYVALRYFNAYGPRMDIYGKYTEVLIRWMERIEDGRAPIIFGDGSQTMDFVHVNDIAWANLLAAEAPVTDVALNVGTGKETSLAELAGLLTRIMGRPDLVPQHQEERAVNPVPRRLADTSNTKRLLGFEAGVPLALGLEDLVAWWRNQRAADQAALSTRSVHA